MYSSSPTSTVTRSFFVGVFWAFTVMPNFWNSGKWYPSSFVIQSLWLCWSTKAIVPSGVGSIINRLFPDRRLEVYLRQLLRSPHLTNSQEEIMRPTKPANKSGRFKATANGVGAPTNYGHSTGKKRTNMKPEPIVNK